MFSWPERLLVGALVLNAALMSYLIYDSIDLRAERDTRMEEQVKIEVLWKEAIERCLAD